jgi:hypothetical protein
MSPTAMPPVFVGQRPKSLTTVHGVKSNFDGGILAWIQPGYDVNDSYVRGDLAAFGEPEWVRGDPLEPLHAASNSRAADAASAPAHRTGHDFPGCGVSRT